LSLSIWVHILIEKYLYQRPLNKVLASLSDFGISLSAGTVCDNLHRISPLFDSLREAIHEKSLLEKWWHADETRWLVMELAKGKLNYRWYIWVFVSSSTVVYVLAPGRATKVIEEFFGSVDEGFLCVDRYSAYKCFVKTHDGFILAFCWAHVRRDFIDVGKNFVECQRFKGTCYRAANWVQVGITQGRGKLDRKNEYAKPIKDILLYPLDRHFRKMLLSDSKLAKSASFLVLESQV
jgi:transposase